MATTTFDPVAYKQTTRAQWQEAAEAWHRWGPTLEEWLGAATELMLDQAQIGPGARARPGGRRRRPDDRRGTSRRARPGSVLATDISPAILDLRGRCSPRGRARERRDPRDGRRGARLRRRHASTRSSHASGSSTSQTSSARCARSIACCGRAAVVSAIVYSTPDRNQFFSIPVGIIRRIAGLPAPAPGLPGPFSLGSPGVLEAAYENAGFEDVDVRAVDAPVRFPTAADCVRFERESFGALHAMLAGVTEAERDQAWREIETELRQFESSDGFEGPCQLLVGGARRGA